MMSATLAEIVGDIDARREVLLDLLLGQLLFSARLRIRKTLSKCGPSLYGAPP